MPYIPPGQLWREAQSRFLKTVLARLEVDQAPSDYAEEPGWAQADVLIPSKPRFVLASGDPLSITLSRASGSREVSWAGGRVRGAEGKKENWILISPQTSKFTLWIKALNMKTKYIK